MRLPAWLETDPRFWGATPAAQWAFVQICELAEISIDPNGDALAAVVSVVRGFGEHPRQSLTPVLDEWCARGLVAIDDERLSVVAGEAPEPPREPTPRNRKARYYDAHKSTENEKRAERRRLQRLRERPGHPAATAAPSVPDTRPGPSRTPDSDAPSGPSRTVPDTCPGQTDFADPDRPGHTSRTVPDSPRAVSESVSSPEKTTETKLRPSVPLKATRARVAGLSGTLIDEPGERPGHPAATAAPSVPDRPGSSRTPDGGTDGPSALLLDEIKAAVRAQWPTDPLAERLDPTVSGVAVPAFLARVASEGWTPANFGVLSRTFTDGSVRAEGYNGQPSLQAMMNREKGVFTATALHTAMNKSRDAVRKARPGPAKRGTGEVERLNKILADDAPRVAGDTAVVGAMAKNFLNSARTGGRK